jgi:hypothetical protein
VPRGRPPQKLRLLDRLSGSELAKLRTRTILETLNGDKTIEEACAVLGVGRSAFHELRNQALEAWVKELEPKSPGRPRSEPSEEEVALRQAMRENYELKRDLRVEQLKTEIALFMPEAQERARQQEERKKKRKRRKRRP